MSEYQYYEWQTVDRSLTEAEQEAVHNLSSHIEVSSSRAVVTYAYGSFKHDPRHVLARFFDAHLYLANWGSRRLMFRFPSELVSRDMIEPHCVQDRITFRTVNAFDVLDMDLSEEEGGGWIEGEGSLSGLISLRNDILQGDYRSVYLAWLKAMSVRDGYRPRGRKPSASKPPMPAIPAGLKQLTPALKRFVEQFDIPACLVEAAAEHGPELAETVAVDFRPLAARLPREECDRFLCRFAQGDVTAGMELKKRLLALEPRPPAASEPGRSIGDLLKRAEAIEVKANIMSAGLADSLSHWTFTDLIEEAGAGDTAFHGGFGLINYQGIWKPAFHAHRFLHRLGDKELGRNGDGIVTRRSRDGGISALLWNYPTRQSVPMANTPDVLDAFLLQGEECPASLEVAGLKPGAPFEVETLDAAHGFATPVWEAMGRPEPPTREQTAVLRKAAMATCRDTFRADSGGVLAFNAVLAPWSIASIRQASAG